MKRLVAVLVVVALVMTGAFAQISFSGYGQAVLEFGATGDEDAKTSLHPGWGGAVPRYGFTLAGNSDNIGFVVEMKADDGDVVVNEKSYIWWKANDVFKVNFGKSQCDALRGKIGDWAEFRSILGGQSNADNIFTRFWPQNGAMLEVTPVDGLFIGASFNVGGLAKDLADGMQVGVGYNIDGIGFIRAQYLGTNIFENGANKDWGGATPDNGGRIEVAFAPAFIDGVAMDFGAKIPLDADKMGYKAVVAGGAAFNIDAVAVTTRVDATIYEKASGIDFWATPSYGLDFATIGMDVTVKVATADGADTQVGFGVAPWISKGYSNGSVKAGVALTKAGAKDSKMGWAVPVALTYWF